MPAASKAKRALNINVSWMVILSSPLNDFLCPLEYGILFFSLGLRRRTFQRRQGKEEYCSLTHHRLCPDSPAVPVNDPLHSCQPDAGSWEFRAGMKALERSK